MFLSFIRKVATDPDNVVQFPGQLNSDLRKLAVNMGMLHRIVHILAY